MASAPCEASQIPVSLAVSETVTPLPGRFTEAEVVGFTTWDDVGTDVWVRDIPATESIQSISDSPDPADVEGLWVHAWNPDNPQDEIWFWQRTYTPLESWEMWDDLIDLGLDQYEVALA